MRTKQSGRARQLRASKASLAIALAALGTLHSIGCMVGPARVAGDDPNAPLYVDRILIGRRLHLAAGTGNVTQARALLEAGANLESAGWNGMTPLMEAARRGQVGSVKFLLTRGANPNRTDQDERTALIWASMLGRADCAGLLLRAGAVRELSDRHGMSAIAYARQRNHLRIVQLLSQKQTQERRK